MIKISSKTPLVESKTANTDIADIGYIRTGGGFRLPKAEIQDSGRIRIGGGFRLPTA